MTILCFGLFVGYFYDLDYRLIDDIRVSVMNVIFLGINSVIKLVRCHRTGLFQCNHICLYGMDLMRCYCHASRRYLQRGKVMRGCYLDQVGRHKPCVPVAVIGIPLSPFGTVFVFHDGGRWCLW